MKRTLCSLLLLAVLIFTVSFVADAADIETATVASTEAVTQTEEESTLQEESTSEEETTTEPSTEPVTTEPTTAEPTTTEPAVTKPTTTEPEKESSDITGQIKIYNSAKQIVQTYEVVINNPKSDSRKPIQWALNYCKNNAAANNIHTIVLPKGEYAIHSSLNMYSNTVLDLSSSTLYRGGSCGSILRFGKKAEVVYGYSGYVNMTVKNGTFDGDDKGTSSLVRFGHASNIEFSNVTFQNTKGVQHLLTFGACENVRVTNCKFLDMEITSAIKNNNCEALQIDVLKEEYFEYPAYDGTRTKNVVISGCYFANVQRGVGTHTAIAGYYFDSIIIKNNTFENITGYAIRGINYINSEISNNVIKNCGSGINCATTPNQELINFFAPINSSDKIINNLNIKICSNTMTLTSNGDPSIAYGVKVAGAVINNYKDADGKKFSGDCRISGITVEGNVITSAVSKAPFYGIYIDGAYGSAYDETSNLAVKNNTVTFNNSRKSSNVIYGVRIDNSSKLYINGNKISDIKSGTKNMHMGIATAYSNSLLISNNKISGVRYCAVKLGVVNKANVLKNTISDTASSSIYICSSSKKVFITSNKITNCAASSIYVSGAKVSRIDSNSIYNSGKYAIYFTTASKCANVISNYICNSKNTGIYLDSTAVVTTITKNQIDLTNKKVDGIAVVGKASAKKITYNKINTKTKKASKSLDIKAKFGIRINSTACQIKYISNNTIKGCVNSGIYIANSATKAKVRYNKIRTSKYGIVYKKAKAKLKDNNIKKCTKARLKVLKVKKANKN